MTTRHPLITDEHLSGWAIAYTRQSTAEQVRHAVGSTLMQRDVVQFLRDCGYPDDRIELVEDLGVSGAKPGKRRRFQYVLQRMRTGVRMVAVKDPSRLGRNLTDWAEFAATARQYRVLFSYNGQVVDFNEPNSEFVTLILGLNAVRENRGKAVFTSEARRKKAEHGIATTPTPAGYVKGPGGTWSKDPDAVVRNVYSLAFDKFDELGSGSAVARFFSSNNIRLPRRTRTGLQWVEATTVRIVAILRNEAYAGTYVYGKTVSVETPEGFTKQKVPDHKWIRKRDHHEPYISYPAWVRIQERLTANRWKQTPAAGRAKALLQSLLWCAPHRRRFRTSYPDRGLSPEGIPIRLARHRCVVPDHAPVSNGCVSIQAKALEPLLEAEIFRTLEPPTDRQIEEGARAMLREHEGRLRQREEEVRLAAQREAEAERAFDQADETQDYVKRKLGERWHKAGRELEELKKAHSLRPLEPPLVLDKATLQKLRALLGDLPALWRRVTPAKRWRFAHHVIKRIWVHPEPEKWRLEIEWLWGDRSSIELMTHRGIGGEIERAWADRATPDEIAATLARRGIVRRTGLKAGEPYSSDAVREFVKARGLQRQFDDHAVAHIRSRINAGVTYGTIAAELTAAGIRHYLGAWTAQRVGHTVRRLWRESTTDQPPLQNVPPIDDPIERLHGLGRTVPEIVASLRDAGIVSRRRRPVTREAVCRALRRRGLRPRSTLDNERLVELLREWTPTSTLTEITRRVHALGLLTRRDTPWTYDSILAKIKSLGLRAAKRERVRDRTGQFVAEETPLRRAENTNNTPSQPSTESPTGEGQGARRAPKSGLVPPNPPDMGNQSPESPGSAR